MALYFAISALLAAFVSLVCCILSAVLYKKANDRRFKSTMVNVFIAVINTLVMLGLLLFIIYKK